MKKQNDFFQNFFTYSKFVWIERMKKKGVAAETPQQRAKFQKATVDSWVANNRKREIKATSEDAVHLALSQITVKSVAKIVAYLLGLIKMKYGAEVALKEYRKAFTGNSFSIKKLKKYFTKARAGVLGFYYGVRRIKWKPNMAWGERLNTKNRRVERTDWLIKKLYSPQHMNITARGWWLVNRTERNSSVSTGGKTMEEGLKALKGDRFIGGASAVTFVKLFKQLDSKTGLTSGEIYKSKTAWKSLDYIVRTMTPRKAKAELAKWFKGLAEDKWIQLPQDKIGMMAMVYGEEAGKYLYRRSGNKIIFVPIQGVKLTPKYQFGGSIKLQRVAGSAKYTVGTWQGYRNYKDFFAKEVKKGMKDQGRYKKLKKELASYKAGR